MTKAIYVFLALVAAIFLVSVIVNHKNEDSSVACTEEAMMCGDGSYVGRTGLNCEFICPTPFVSDNVQTHIDSKADLISLQSPLPNALISSPLTITGKARGNWFFEATFPVLLTNWDGLIIAEGFATAESDWMTTEFVPFKATLDFVSPYGDGTEDFMKRGSLILKKDNPSGLQEYDNSLEIPVRFAE
jgi:hypothetical protein